MRVATGERLLIHPRLPTLMASLWALCEHDTREHLSVQRSLPAIEGTVLRHGDALMSNRDRTLLTWLDGPVHDARKAFRAACDDERWGGHGHYKPGHCEDQFREALGHGLFGPSKAPCPLHLFTADDDDAMDGHPEPSWDAPILLRAEIALIVVVSAKPRHALSVDRVLATYDAPALQIL